MSASIRSPVSHARRSENRLATSPAPQTLANRLRQTNGQVLMFCSQSV